MNELMVNASNSAGQPHGASDDWRKPAAAAFSQWSKEVAAAATCVDLNHWGFEQLNELLMDAYGVIDRTKANLVSDTIERGNIRSSVSHFLALLRGASALKETPAGTRELLDRLVQRVLVEISATLGIELDQAG